jgi:hypothetical protein
MYHAGLTADDGRSLMQQYDVTYLSGGEEFTQRVEAVDAASAASKVQTEHGREEGMFELLSISLIEPDPAEESVPQT